MGILGFDPSRPVDCQSCWVGEGAGVSGKGVEGVIELYCYC